MKNYGKLVLMAFIVSLSLFACKSKKNVVKDQQVVKVDSSAILNNKMNADKEVLRSIVNGTSTMTLEEQEAFVKKMKAAGYSDSEIQDLLNKANTKIAETKAANEKKVLPMKTLLADNFAKIMNAGSYAEADAVIKETLEKFSSPDAPVLVILYQSGEDVDYDKPTTIKDYLNYLKLQKKSNSIIYKVYYDENHKIKSLDLKHK